MNHPTDRIAHTTAFVTPVVEHWLERECQMYYFMESKVWKNSRTFDYLCIYLYIYIMYLYIYFMSLFLKLFIYLYTHSFLKDYTGITHVAMVTFSHGSLTRID